MNRFILFSDIRGFKKLSEGKSPEEKLEFLHAYSKRIEPVIEANQGVMHKQIGDAFVALFDQRADDALKAGIGMLKLLRESDGEGEPIEIGIAINIAEEDVSSDALNAVSCVEARTKNYGAPMLITDVTFQALEHPLDYAIRMVDRVLFKGEKESVALFEVMDGEAPKRHRAKVATAAMLGDGLGHYYSKEFDEALGYFNQCLEVDPDDKTVKLFVERATRFAKEGVSDDWTGVVDLDE